MFLKDLLYVMFYVEGIISFRRLVLLLAYLHFAGKKLSLREVSNLSKIKQPVLAVIQSCSKSQVP